MIYRAGMAAFIARRIMVASLVMMLSGVVMVLAAPLVRLLMF